MASSATHWDQVYGSQRPERVSWFRAHLEVSLELLLSAGLNTQSRVIDVGGGASTLVDDLLDRGVEHVTVLDISAAALQVSRDRLGDRAVRVRWIVSDVGAADLDPDSVDLWHDRAALHFLTDLQDVQRYVRVASNSIAVGGHAIIAGFASDGPDQCSRLPVVQRDAEQIAELFAERFKLTAARRELHSTPRGAPQSFAYALLQKIR
ncbi:MAG TPA: class I SAM-dependent methyltransferase [Steroidobacteraceae bacterium]|nr:class I SAM-dependent methyltransferase [Steroidobacteraceae bacterium]